MKWFLLVATIFTVASILIAWGAFQVSSAYDRATDEWNRRFPSENDDAR